MRPIIFSGEMVRAILDGRKTQTRRVIKPQPLERETTFWNEGDRWFGVDEIIKTRGKSFGCPYGRPGDRLWVRETWRELGSIQLADGSIPSDGSPDRCIYWEPDHDQFEGPWRPSIHMPRWASRLTLEVTNVRVERVQDINVYDAIAEGVVRLTGAPPRIDAGLPVPAFRDVWDTINAKRGYGWANPWVWVLAFRRASDA